MSKVSTQSFNGKQYIEIEPANFGGATYKRFVGSDYTNPEVLLLDKGGNCLEKDSELYIKIREKYAINKDAFHGSHIIESMDLTKVKKFVAGVIVAAGITTSSLLGTVDMADAGVRGYYASSKETIQNDWKEELKAIPSFKDVKIMDYKSDPTTFNGRKFQQTFSIVKSGQDKNEILSTLFCDESRDICFREYSDYFIEKAQNDLNETFLENDKKEFAARAASDKDLSAIARKRGVENVAQWYKSKMDDVKYVYAPNIASKAHFDYQKKIIAFSSFVTAEAKKIRAHEMAHAISYEQVSNTTERSGMFVSREVKVGNRIMYDERGRAINEGVTNLIADILSAEKNSYYPYEELTGIAQQLLSKYGAETLFESYLHDPNIIGNRMNKDHDSRTAFIKFVHNLDEFQRLNEKVRSLASKSDIADVSINRDKMLKDAEKFLDAKKTKKLPSFFPIKNNYLDMN